jgi:uncharacterized glyoxalase superfamily protein PhnB
MDTHTQTAATLWPVLRCTDAPAAIRFLTAAFGFTEALVPGEADGVIAHAELGWPPGGGVMLGSFDERVLTHRPSGGTSVYAVTDDPDSLFDRAVAAGAEVVQGPLDEPHGRGFTVRDAEGNLWSFGTYRGAAPTAGAQRDTGGIRRAMPHIASERFEESREFYVGFLGFTEAMDLGRIVTFVSPTNPTAQISVVAPEESPRAQPSITVEVGDVDAVHADAVRRGLRVVHPLTDEPWGVRRFFVVDPNGTVLNLMSHR